MRKLHIYLGLSLGLLFSIVGLSGSILVFYVEIDALLNHGKLKPAATYNIEYEDAYKTLQSAFPELDGVWRLEINGATDAIAARYYKPPQTRDKDFAPLMVWLSNDGSHVIRQDYWGQYAMTFIYDLHYRLLAGEVGGKILGYSSLLIIVFLIAGFLTWLPRKGQMHQAIKFKSNSGTIRRLYDIHKLSGVYSLFFLLILTITGVMLELPKESEFLLGKFIAPISEFKTPISRESNLRNVTIDAAINKVNATIPDSEVKWIETPAKNSQFYKMRLKTKEDPSNRFPHSFAYINKTTGNIEKVYLYKNQSSSSKIMNWLHTLHDGTLIGIYSRLCYVLIGFLPVILYITGIMRYIIRIQRK